ncbi:MULTISPECIES: MBL fold metallo-hydrolase [unclassified Bosea (in: a-proteobacteria)]|uniref:AidB family quorum-quenching N-acyl homoserine lactonase n=1 Tax=unclassified Bosea (in: a-proteobacteria) TaxID=2653178 RepID=UPI000F74E951|nr:MULTISPECIES: MBL fold metallo-hydrolase [unclassified Bosea (in: a-proteobacteria)]AZO76404.1 MBL fold metallo-hydrolase [Bosea sp. Tri-49]RXT26331.1 MBL fold metallo-hydrolase [Bosea sp. Tri-39]RXT31572.1 MBL fold metallo-hydrolase [Bosea sp. Tri-54]
MGETWRRFGSYDVLTLHDGVFEAPLDVLIHASGQAARDESVSRWGKPKVSIPVNCFALKHADGITLVDAGTGPSWGEAMGHAPAAMASAGIAPEQVERVLITHLHGDHALGLFDGDRARFLKAEIIVPEADFGFFGNEANRAQTPQNRQGGFAVATAVKKHYGDRIRPVAAGPVRSGIALIPLPGHTVGHSGYLIEGEESLLLWGDALHLSDLQASDPDVGLVYDFDAATAVASRRAILERAARDGWVVSGGHVDGFRRVIENGSEYELIPA